MGRKLSPYGRKDWLRKRSGNKTVHRGVDAAFRGIGAAVGSAAKVQTPDSTFEERQRANLTGKQLLIACAVGSILPLMALLGVDEIVDEIDGVFLAVLVFFFLIPFLVMVLIFKIFNLITRPHTAQPLAAPQEETEESVYSPNPEWMGQTDLVNSCQNAKILAPQFLKQAQESAKILQTTTEPATFFTRYDFCVGRLIELEKCKRYGAPVSTTSDLTKYRSIAFRDEAVNEVIHRTADKYRTKIESLKTQKAKKNWAEKYQQAFEPYLPYISDKQKTVLEKVSAGLFALADSSCLEGE
nr:MAG TPA: hypothetical protein [Caudoviricetes sp.]